MYLLAARVFRSRMSIYNQHKYPQSAKGAQRTNRTNPSRTNALAAQRTSLTSRTSRISCTEHSRPTAHRLSDSRTALQRTASTVRICFKLSVDTLLVRTELLVLNVYHSKILVHSNISVKVIVK